MNFPVAQTIKEVGAPEMAAATGIPLRTIYRWQQLDKVSGTGIIHNMRVVLLKEAAAKLRRDAANPKKARRAA